MPDNHTQQRVYHYRSSAITNSEIEKPNANNLDFGEIAINYNAQEPSLFIKQNDSEIAQFVDKKYIEDNINSLIGNGALTIQKNGTNVGSFSANQTTNKTINIVVPTTASDVNALPDSTKYAASLSLDINSSTYVVTAQLKDQEGNNLGTQQTIDLPLETMVVSGSYISSAKTVSLVLQNGNKIEFSVADLVSGLQTEITDSNKLSADLIENGNTNKVFTSSEKTKLSNLASSLATTSASGYMSSTQVTKLNGIESGAEVNVQPDWNETNSGSDAYIKNKPTIPTTTSQLTNDSGFITVSGVPQELFICNISQQMVDGQLVYSCDKTWSEIYTAHQSGKLVLLLASSTVFTPSVIQPNGGSFESDRYNYFEGVGGVYFAYNLTYTTSTNEWKFIYGTGYEFSQSYKEKFDSIASGAQVNVQSDWNETNSGSDAYILNKPTKLSQLTNDSGFITSAVTSLKNYATSANVVSELDKKVETFECEFTMTMDSNSQEEFPYNCTITCDKTVNEISSAAANGKKILAKCDISNMFAELSGIQYISYWEITNNIYNGENAYVGFDVDMIMVLVGEIHFSVFGYGEDNLWELGVAVNSNDLDRVHNLQPVAWNGTIGYLNDVAIYDSPSSGQILQYDGTNWVNVDVDNNNALSSLSDVLLSGVTSGQTLQYNGTKWVNVDNKNTSDIINITYAELKQLRDSSGLTPNQEYRITDYETLVNPYRLGMGGSIIQIAEGVSASTHLFDIIVRAMSESVLDVNARAEHHNGDTYFENSDLSKWSLKYTIDNDTFVHQWALDLYDISLTSDGETNNLTVFILSKKNDLYYYAGKVDGGDYIGFCSNDRVLTTQSQLYSVDLEPLQATINSVTHRSGKGVIYNMIDEYNNNCPYDFKNILFKRTKCIFSATTKDLEHVDTLIGSNGEYQMFGNGSFESGGSLYFYLRKDDDTHCDYCINRSGLEDIDSLNSATILAVSSMTQYDSVVSYTRPLIDYLDNKTYGNIGMMFGIADESIFGHSSVFTFDETFSKYFYTFSFLTNQVTIDDCSVQGKASHNIITESTTICGYILNLATPTMLPNNVFITEKSIAFDEPSMNVASISDNTLTKSINNTLIYTSGTDNPVNPYNSGINGITFNYSHYNIMVNPCISLSNSYSNLIFDCGYESGAFLGENWIGNLFVDSTAYVGGFLTSNLIVSCGEQVSLYGECGENKIFGSTTSLCDSIGNYIINTSRVNLQGHNDYCRIGSKLIYPNGMHITLLPRVGDFAISMPQLEQNYIVYDKGIILNDTNNYNDDYMAMNTITVRRNSQGVVKYYNEADLIQ